MRGPTTCLPFGHEAHSRLLFLKAQRGRKALWAYIVGRRETKRARRVIDSGRSPFGHILGVSLYITSRFLVTPRGGGNILRPEGAQSGPKYSETARALWLSPLRGDKEVGVSSSPLGSVAPSAFAPTGAFRPIKRFVRAPFGVTKKQSGPKAHLCLKALAIYARRGYAPQRGRGDALWAYIAFRPFGETVMCTIYAQRALASLSASRVPKGECFASCVAGQRARKEGNR